MTICFAFAIMSLSVSFVVVVDAVAAGDVAVSS